MSQWEIQVVVVVVVRVETDRIEQNEEKNQSFAWLIWR